MTTFLVHNVDVLHQVCTLPLQANFQASNCFSLDAMEHWAVPLAFFTAIANPSATLGAVSAFDGCGSLSRALNEHGIASLGYDITNDEIYENCLTLEGVQFFLMMLVRVAVGGVVWLGPPCCSWIWLTRSKSKRTRSQPEGNVHDPWVRQHNCIADFVAKVILVCHERGIYFIIEQPLSSVLFHYAPIAEAIAIAGGRSVSVRLGDFGAETTKPLRLVGTAPWLDGLPAVGEKLRSTSGRVPMQTLAVRQNHAVTGKRDVLQESSAYPTCFAVHVARLHQEFLQLRKLRAQRLKRKVADSEEV